MKWVSGIWGILRAMGLDYCGTTAEATEAVIVSSFTVYLCQEKPPSMEGIAASMTACRESDCPTI